MMKKWILLFCYFYTALFASSNQKNTHSLNSDPVIDITDINGVISAQYDDSPSGETIDKVIDNSAATKYLTFHASAWIQYTSGLFVVTGYSITSANDVPERDPKQWTLKASNDLSEWTILDSRKNEDFPDRFQKRFFRFINKTPYLYYRLEMTNNSGSILQLSEWEILGTLAQDTSSVVPAPPSELVATAESESSVRLTWKDNADNETIFRIEWSMDGKNWSFQTLVSANSTSFAVTDLIDSTFYYFRIAAINSTGESISNIGTGWTLALPQDPPCTVPDLEEPDWMKRIVPPVHKTSNYLESQKIYDVTTIASVHISMSESGYDSLINNQTGNTYLRASMTYESPLIPKETIENVGIRMRGAVVRTTNKKAFKISMREFGYDDREFHGIRKLNLNSDFQDPCLMRAKICTDLFRRMGVPAARVGYARLYINNEYRGIFDNYEEFDKVFLTSRFGENDGNLYKGRDNATMEYRNSEVYNQWSYDLITNEELNDYSDLIHFIDILNNTPDSVFTREIEKVFDVEEFLMFTACNVLLGAWDDYWFLVKNYYFYHNLNTGKFEYIPHDFDGSLGTDWAYGEIADANVYTWGKGRSRPMIDRLLEVPAYRKKYTYNLLLLCNWAFSLEVMEPGIERTKSLIRQTVINDPFWAADFGRVKKDFDDSFIEAIPHGNVKYGLKEYISLRQASALSQLDNYSPFIHDVDGVFYPDQDSTVLISAFILDESSISSVKLNMRNGIGITKMDMHDDGYNGDLAKNDHIYSASFALDSPSEYVQYYITAIDKYVKLARYPSDGTWITLRTGQTPPKIFINELLADNEAFDKNEFGQYSDWIELYNADTLTVNLAGLYITDNLSDPTKWKLPDLMIPPNGFCRIWADDDTIHGGNHIGFALNKKGEELGLFDTDANLNQPIDTIHFGSQQTDISYGRIQDGAETWKFFMIPTPGFSNSGASNKIFNLSQTVNEFRLYQNYPNPFNPVTIIEFQIPQRQFVTIRIFNTLGQRIQTLVSEQKEPGKYKIIWNGKNDKSVDVARGIYFYQFNAGNYTQTRKMLLF